MVLAEKNGYSKNQKINDFVQAVGLHKVAVAHVRSEANLADTLSREKDPPTTTTIVKEVRALPEQVNNSEKINKHRRSGW